MAVGKSDSATVGSLYTRAAHTCIRVPTLVYMAVVEKQTGPHQEQSNDTSLGWCHTISRGIILAPSVARAQSLEHSNWLSYQIKFQAIDSHRGLTWTWVLIMPVGMSLVAARVSARTDLKSRRAV